MIGCCPPTRAGLAPERAAPTRGWHIASIGLDRTREALAEVGVVGVEQSVSPCSCPDCALGIPRATMELAAGGGR